MQYKTVLNKIRNELFYGSADYTKNQPDLFMPHHFQMLAPSQVGNFVETLKEDIRYEKEILLYIHLPFCFSQCVFCNSFPHPVDRNSQQSYLSHLLKEIDLFAKSGIFHGKKAKCIYFGGGTPTSFPAGDLGRILEKIRSVIDLNDLCSISTEAHPQTLGTEKKIGDLASIGMNRLSIGCQTFDLNILDHCNRMNTESQIRRIVQTAQANGIYINVDMMTGLPGQTIASVNEDLRILDNIQPDGVEYIRHEVVNPHMARLYESRPDLVVDDDTLFEMVLMTQEWMAKNNYEQNGRFSNELQWGYRFHWLHEMPIIAFGSRTRSYTRGICYDKHQDLPTYQKMIDRDILPLGRYMLLSKKEQMFRSLILGLQLKTGLDVREFFSKHGKTTTSVFPSILQILTEYGCIEQVGDFIRLTTHGAYFVEDVCDYITDAVLKDEPGNIARKSHSGGICHGGPSATQ